jgi:hypothetical protein
MLTIERSHTRWIALFALSAVLALAGCGPPGESDESDTGGSAADTSDGGEMDTGVDTSTEDTTEIEDADVDASDVEQDNGIDADSGMDTDTTSDTSDGADTALAVTTTEFGAGTTTVATTIDFSTGDVASDIQYQTIDLALDQSAGRLFAHDRRCSRSPDSCSVPAGFVLELEVARDGSLSQARKLDLPRDVYNPYAAGFVDSQDQTFTVSYQSSEAYQYGTGETRRNELDLSPFDAGGSGSDTDPEAADVAVDGDFVYFLLQRLSGSNFTPEENSALAGYDTSSDSFIDFDAGTSETTELDLQGKNAVAMRQTPNGTWAIGFSVTAGAVDKNGKIVTLADEGSGKLSVDATVVTETELDGDIQNFAFTAEQKGLAIVGRKMDSKLVTFDASGSSVQTNELLNLSGYAPALCLTPNRSEAWVGKIDGSQTEFIGYDTQSGSELSKTGPKIAGTIPSCQVVETTN